MSIIPLMMCMPFWGSVPLSGQYVLCICCYCCKGICHMRRPLVSQLVHSMGFERQAQKEFTRVGAMHVCQNPAVAQVQISGKSDPSQIPVQSPPFLIQISESTWPSSGIQPVYDRRISAASILPVLGCCRAPECHQYLRARGGRPCGRL